jgi:hypothetical protein
MKKQLIFIFIFHAFFAISAQATVDGHEDEGLPPNEVEVNHFEKIVNSKLVKTSLEDLVYRTCLSLMHAKGSGVKNLVNGAGKAVESIFLKHLELTRDSRKYEQKIAQFWDKHHNSFVCPENTHYGRKHILKVVLDMQMYEPVLFDFFLKEDQKYKLNMNAYEMVNNNPETVLDYLDDIKNGKNLSFNYNIPEINELIEILEDEYKALRGKDLKR